MVLSVLAYTLFFLVVIGTILVILTDEDGDSGKKIAWILIIVLLPIVGITFYIMLGFDIRRTRLFNTRRRDFLKFFHTRADMRTRRLLYGDTAFNRAHHATRQWLLAWKLTLACCGALAYLSGRTFTSRRELPAP